jgi:hypothetical protein
MAGFCFTNISSFPVSKIKKDKFTSKYSRKTYIRQGKKKKTKKLKPYTAIHGSQNLSTYRIMLSRIQTFACYLVPARKEDHQTNFILTILFYSPFQKQVCSCKCIQACGRGSEEHAT